MMGFPRVSELLAPVAARSWAIKLSPVGSKSPRGPAFAASIGRSFNRRACPRKDFRAVFFLRKLFRNSVSFNVPQPDSRRRCARKKSKCRRMRFRVPHACRQFALALSQHRLMLFMCFNRKGFRLKTEGLCLDVALACRRSAA
jgi:hypothetical protein